MKIICNNVWVSFFHTKSYREFNEQIMLQKPNQIITLNTDKKGIYYYCISGNDSLTQKKIFCLVFSSDYTENNIYFLAWDKLFILSTGSALYFIHSDPIKINTSLNLFSSLIGLYITKDSNLLVLEELYCRMLSSDGRVMSEYHFDDIIDDFELQGNTLFIKKNNELHTIKLV